MNTNTNPSAPTTLACWDCHARQWRPPRLTLPHNTPPRIGWSSRSSSSPVRAPPRRIASRHSLKQLIIRWRVKANGRLSHYFWEIRRSQRISGVITHASYICSNQKWLKQAANLLTRIFFLSRRFNLVQSVGRISSGRSAGNTRLPHAQSQIACGRDWSKAKLNYIKHLFAIKFKTTFLHIRLNKFTFTAPPPCHKMFPQIPHYYSSIFSRLHF